MLYVKQSNMTVGVGHPISKIYTYLTFPITTIDYTYIQGQIERSFQADLLLLNIMRKHFFLNKTGRFALKSSSNLHTWLATVWLCQVMKQNIETIIFFFFETFACLIIDGWYSVDGGFCEWCHPNLRLSFRGITWWSFSEWFPILAILGSRLSSLFILPTCSLFV